MTDVERREKAEADLAEVILERTKVEVKIAKEELKRLRKANKEVG